MVALKADHAHKCARDRRTDPNDTKIMDEQQQTKFKKTSKTRDNAKKLKEIYAALDLHTPHHYRGLYL